MQKQYTNYNQNTTKVKNKQLKSWQVLSWIHLLGLCNLMKSYFRSVPQVKTMTLHQRSFPSSMHRCLSADTSWHNNNSEISQRTVTQLSLILGTKAVYKHFNFLTLHFILHVFHQLPTLMLQSIKLYLMQNESKISFNHKQQQSSITTRVFSQCVSFLSLL